MARKMKTVPKPIDPSDLHGLLTLIGRQLLKVEQMRIAAGNQLFRLKAAGFDLAYQQTLDPMTTLPKAVEDDLEKTLVAYMRRHPLAPWVEARHGIGLPSIGLLLSVTGSLDRYENPAKLWKWLGLDVHQGRARKRQRGEVARWSDTGRMVAIGRIGASLVKSHGPDRERYDTKRAEYLARPRLGPSGCPFGQTHTGFTRETDAQGWSRKVDNAKKTLPCIHADETGKESSAHVHAAALRYAVKKLIADLWGEWQRVRPAQG